MSIYQKAVEILRNPREYAVGASGHGSGYVFDGAGWPDKPTPPHKTLNEARKEALDWVSNACSIGGRAAIYYVPTMTIVERF